MKRQILTLLLTSTAGLTQAADLGFTNQTFQGFDEHQEACSVTIGNVDVMPTVMHSSCEFEMDGPGPWCDENKTLPMNELHGSGELKVAGHEAVPFEINDEFVELNKNPIGVTSINPGSDGKFISVTLTISPATVKAHYTFLTPYGKKLSSDEIMRLFRDRPNTVPYQDVYNKIYFEVNCAAQR